jgi:putative PIN family toxin of toxin-antitoxin system
VRIVVDTNVLISAAFFGGRPLRILGKCITGEHQLAISLDILEEYRRVGEEFMEKQPGVDFDRFLNLVFANAVVVQSPKLEDAICRDPDDDKFIACAVATGAKVIVSGDKDLLSLSEYAGVKILRPNEFEGI